MTFEGTWVWIWDIPQCDAGNVAAIVGRLRAAGAAGGLIKGTDADHGYNDWTQVGALVSALRAAGLGAATWSYHYTGSAAEASAVVQLCQTVRPDAHVLDVEQEVEDLPRPDQAATRLVTGIRAAMPILPLGYAPIGSIRNHLRAPYRQFTDAGLVMLPQLYWVGFGWTPRRTVAEFYADVATYDLAQQPIYPAYEDAPSAGYGVTVADLAQFLTDVRAQGATGVSVWSYQHLDAAGWQRVAQSAFAFPAPVPADPCAAVTAELAAVTTERDRYKQALGDVQATVAAALGPAPG